MKLKKFISGVTAIVLTSLSCGIQSANCEPIGTDALNEQSLNEQFVEERVVMRESEIPEAIDYEVAAEKGHCERLYDEEPDLNTMVFKNVDNSNSLYYFNYPVKYYDDNGVVRDKTSLLVDDESSESFVSNFTDIKTSFSKNLEDGISLEYKDTQLTMLPMFVDSDECEGELSEDSKNVVYDCGESVSLDYALTYTGFKENIILDQYNGISKFDFLLNTNGLKLTSNSENALNLYDENENLAATIGDIIVYDSNSNVSLGSLSFEEITPSSEYVISVNVDSDFLTSSDTVYPVYIDPTIEIDYEHTGIYGAYDETPGIVHATFYSDDTASFGETMKVGKINSSTAARTVMRFPGLIYLVRLFQMDRTLITGANVYIRDIGYQSDVNAININCHKFHRPWSQTWDLKWSRDSESYLPEVLSSNVICHSNGASLTPLHTYSFDITPLVTNAWGNNDMNEWCWKTGIMFKADDDVENGNNIKYASFGSFNSVYYAPYLVIDYNDPESEYRYSENADISYTYKTSMRLTAGKTYKFRTGKATNYSGCNTELYLFKSDEMEPGNNSWYNNDISSNNRYSEIEATISSTGTYTLMAKCYTSPQAPVSYAAPTGHCNIYETNPDTNVETLKAEDAVLGGYILNLYSYNLVGKQDESITYSSFTANCSAGLDPVMFIMGSLNSSSNRVIGYNDDYSTFATGNFSWERNARINQNYSSYKKPIYIFVSSYSQSAIGTCEIYGVYKNSLPNTEDPETQFPNLKLDDSIISASASEAYNCIAYSGGITSMWIDPTLKSQLIYLSPWYNENNETALDNFYGNNPPRYKGATTYEVTTNENESVVNVYKKGNEWTHAAVRRPGNNNVHGYAWESKLGDGERIFHAIDSLSSDKFGNQSKYGEVARMYKVSETNNSNISAKDSLQEGLTVEKEVVLSDEQLDFLNQKLEKIDYDTTSQFYDLYDKWVDYIDRNDSLKYSNSISDYQENTPYEELHKFIVDNPETFFIVARDYYAGHISIFTNIILVYEFVDKNEYSIELANKIRETNNAVSINSLKEEVYIAPSYEANMKTFINSMLNSESYKLMQSE
ncbi:MAG: hypothetical protein NC177_17525 [Ruminococcus flavefaciens]|nr:hypothetical protein [Ruminococcus flavefaciens]